MPNFITVNGETHSIKEWATIKQLDKRLIQARIRAGWPPEEAVTKPKSHVGRPKMIRPQFFGDNETMTTE